MKLNKSNILVIAGGSMGNLSVITNINKILKIITQMSNKIYLITYCDDKRNNFLKTERIFSINDYKNVYFNFIYAQIFTSLKLCSLSKKYDKVFFVFGQDLLIIPIIFSKLLGKKVIIRSDGRPSTIIKKYFKSDSIIKRFLFRIIEEINYRLADLIFTENGFMLIENSFNKYSNVFIGNLFVDTNNFKIENALSNREFDIGFIGRFSREKGIENFINCIPNIIRLNSNIKILIGGNGDLQTSIQNAINKIKYPTNVTLIDWISFDKMPNYLNKIKILVIPSYKEGLPNIILEAMASGTLVLATPVGGIPGIIIDKDTGFIMENNTPECITKNIIRALSSPNKKKIAENGRNLVVETYSFEKTVAIWKNAGF